MKHIEAFKGVAKSLVRAGYVMVICCLLWLQCPALSHPHRKPEVSRAMGEISDIKLAVEEFRLQYARWPMTTEALSATKPDFTFGTWEVVKEENSVQNRNGRGYQANNSGVLIILMNEVHPKFNPNHANNPQKKVFLNPARDNQEDGKPGIGPSRVWLDPWGHPYIISLDVNGDGWVEDAFYSRAKVSAMFAKGAKGLYGLESRGGEG